MRVALVHDYLNQRGGAERVFAHIARAYPQAPVYTALYDATRTGDLVDPARVRVSWLQRVPFAGRAFRGFAPLYPAIFEGFDLSPYDLILSSTTAWAKGVRVPPGAVHVCYINTVSRFAFDYERYVGGFGLGVLARPVVRGLVAWDRIAAARPTCYVANSANVAARVRAFYGRESRVLHCPVDLDRFAPSNERAPHFLAVARLLPYKRLDVAIDACASVGVPLLIAGDGPARPALERRARGSETTFLGPVGDAVLAPLMASARAVIVTAEEDFGLVPLEANASGRPAIAFRGGGALETIVEGVTGEFFAAQRADSLAAVLRAFDERRYDPARLRAQAERFSPQRFVAGLRAIVDETVAASGRA